MKSSSIKDLPLSDIDSEVSFWRSDRNVAALYQTHRQDGAADVIARMSVYYRDSSLPFWRMNVDVDALFAAHAHNPDRAKAWLTFRDAEKHPASTTARMMRGSFVLGILANHTYNWTFTPTHLGDLAIVVPIYEDNRMVDILAMSRIEPNMWGCCTGAGQSTGAFTNPLTVHRSPLDLLSGSGILPLARAYFPILQFASKIVAQDGNHAWEIANHSFVRPAEQFGLNCHVAEQTALDRISFVEAA